MKVAQTGILWSQVQVLVGPPEKNPHRPRWGFIDRLVVTYKDSLTISAL